MNGSDKNTNTADGILYGIAYDCPALNRCGDCPLNEIDALSFPEKVDWIKKLSPEEKDRLLKHHEACSGKRLHDVL